MRNALANVKIDFVSKNQLEVVLEALKPEISSSTTIRSNVKMKVENQSIELIFFAQDTSALRASMNSYLRLIGVILDLQKFSKI